MSKGNLNLIKKKDLAREIAKQSHMTIGLANEMIDSVFRAVRTMMLRGYDVRIPGFGIFYIYETTTPTRKVLPSGEVMVPPYKRAKFKASRIFTNAITNDLGENFEMAGFEYNDDDEDLEVDEEQME